MDSDSFDNERFTTTIIVFAVIFHLLLIALVCYYGCCRKNQRTRESRPSAILGRRHSVGRHGSIRYEHNENVSNSHTRNTTTTENATPQRDPTEFETRPVTNWQTSFLTRVRSQVERLTRSSANPTPPPPYSVDNNSDGEGVVNQAMVVEEGNDLPSYHDYLHRQPSYHEDYVDWLEGEKPPPYEEVVQKANNE